MPWTKKQETYMRIHWPEVAKRVMGEPGYQTKKDPPQIVAARKTRKGK